MNGHGKSSDVSLAGQQSQLVARILSANAPNGALKRGQGLAVYRRNLLAVAEAALGVSFPTTRRLLGQATFAALLAELLELYPPTQGDWGEWGEELPRLLETSEQGKKYPFIAPVAELDWLRHRANRAADNRFDSSTAQLLESHHMDGIGLAIAEVAGVTRSIFPLVQIFDWHAGPSDSEHDLPVFESPRPVLVYRREFRVEQRYISPSDYDFFIGLRAGRPLGRLLDELSEQEFSFPVWLEQAINLNLVNRFYLI